MITLNNHVVVGGLYILLKNLELSNDRLDKGSFITAQNLIEMQDIKCVTNTQLDSVQSIERSRGLLTLSLALGGLAPPSKFHSLTIHLSHLNVFLNKVSTGSHLENLCISRKTPMCLFLTLWGISG